MSRSSSIKKIVNQASVHLSGIVFTTGVGFFFKIYIARELGAEFIGYHAFGTALVYLLATIVSAGIGTSIVKFLPIFLVKNQYKSAQELIGRAVAQVILSGLLLAGFFFLLKSWLSISFFDNEEFGSYVPIFCLILIIQSFVVVQTHIIRGLQEVKLSTMATNYLQVASKISFAVVFLSLGWGFKGLLIAEMIAGIIAALVLFFLIKKLLPFSFKLKDLNFNSLKPEIKKYSQTMFSSNLIAQSLNQGDKLILGYFLSPSALGIYSIASTLANFIPLPQRSINSILGPIVSEKFAEKKLDELRSLYVLFTKWSILVAVPLILSFLIFPRYFLGMFGEEFIEASLLLQLLALSFLINISSGAVGVIMIMTGQEKRRLYINILQGIATYALYFSLIPVFGIEGAAIASICGVILSNIFSLYFIYKSLNIHPYSKDYLRASLPVVICVLLFYLFKVMDLNVNPYFTIALILAAGYFVFAFTYYLFGITKEEKLFLDGLKAKFGIT